MDLYAPAKVFVILARLSFAVLNAAASPFCRAALSTSCCAKLTCARTLFIRSVFSNCASSVVAFPNSLFALTCVALATPEVVLRTRLTP